MRKSMLVVGLVLLCAGMPVLGQNCGTFTDVLAADGICPDVLWMKTRGITLGCTATQYCPNTAVTRASMALFMHRLGNALQPAGVVLVAASGGDYTSIQAAIDAAAAALPPSPTHNVVVKIAPGNYNEQVTLKDYVDLEGSGMNETVISNSGPGGTMIAGANSEVRNLSVLNTHDGVAPGAAIAVYQAGNTAAGGFTLFTHVSLSADGPTDNIAVQVTGGGMTIEGRGASAGASGGTGAAVGVHAGGAGTSVRVRKSILGVSATGSPRFTAYVDGGASMFIENTQINADTFGTPACFNTFNQSFVANT